MALSANTVWEVRPAGSGAADTNGGGFVTGSGGTDYSQQDSPQLTVTDGACSGTTTLTSATGGFTSAMVGNILYLSSGPGWYQITAYTDTNTVTLDRAGPSASGMTVNVGGALATPGGLAAVVVAHGVNHMTGWLKAGTYTLTSSTANVSGGRWGTGITFTLNGYNSTRGDLHDRNSNANRPVVSAGAVTGITGFTSTSWSTSVRCIIYDGNSGASNIGFGQVQCYNCEARNCPAGGFSTSTSGGDCSYCHADSCGDGFQQCRLVVRCSAKSCTRGFYRNTMVVDCVGISNGSELVYAGDSRITVMGFSSYDCGGDIVDGPGNQASLIGIAAYSGGGYGIDPLASGTPGNSYLLADWRWGALTSGFLDTANGTPIEANNVELSGNPFADTASDDLSPDNVTGEGASLRHAIPNIPGIAANTRNIGAVQHADPTGGGGLLTHPGMSGGMRG